MQEFEQLGAFYLGRRIDEQAGTTGEEPLLYDSADLVTHGLCVGMTGSGKTGLAISLIEEAAIDGVPALVIDPKGDMGNLLLTFPGLAAADFEPWVNASDAQQAGQSSADFAAAEAARWQSGLAASGQDGPRIQRLRDSAEFTLFTPGSTAGVPVSVLSSFVRPQSSDPELLSERAQSTVTGLLGLAGIDSDPVKSREHILLSLLLLAAWEAGESPDLATLIARVQQPPFQRVGVLELEAFFPPKDRFAFALALNSLIAAPGFNVWMQGAALDIAQLLRTASGKPRVSIFSLAHLDDAQRMFFVTLLLGAIIGWMRSQSGTTSLRALVYMDEIFGFFPPVANPPSKTPLLTLLKQARAFGLGIVLATQNPVDLDYKGLSNIGTWWLGRLQTERDKSRLLDGLEAAGGGVERSEVERLLSGLRKRCFLMRNVHDHALSLFETRWAMSYLRGPLGREDIRRLSSNLQRAAQVPIAVAEATPSMDVGITVPEHHAQAPLAGRAAATSTAPLLPPELTQFFASAAEASVMEAVVYAHVELRYSDARLKLDWPNSTSLIAPLRDGPIPLDWNDSERTTLDPSALRPQAPAAASFLPLPAAAARKASYEKWSAELSRWLRDTATLELFYSPSTKLTSQPEESEREFRARLQQAAREQRDAALARLRAKYAPKQEALQERLRRAEQAVEREREQARDQKLQTTISLGTTLLGALLGRKAISKSNLGRAASAARGAGRAMKESGDIARAQETVAAVADQLRALDSEFAGETAALASPGAALHEPLESVMLLPKRGAVAVKLLTLLWLPQEPA